jgi:TPR repeat protein
MRTNEQLETCQAHGLHFDPRVSTGCVLCRRSQQPPAEASASRGARLRWPELGIAVGLIVVTVAIAFGLWRRGNPVWSAASDRNAGTNSLSSSGPQRLKSPPVGSWTFLASPDLLPLQANGRSCDGGDEAACSRFIAKCKSSGAYPAKPYSADHPSHPLEGTCGAVYDILLKRCRRDQVEACTELGQRSISFRERACQLGDAASCANIVEHPEFVAEEEAALAVNRCEMGDTATCMRLARQREARTPPDVEGADDLRRQACRQGHRPACEDLDERAAEVLRQARQDCEAGRHEACQWMQRYAMQSPQGGPVQAEEFRRRGLAIIGRKCETGDRKACRDLDIQLMSADGEQSLRSQARLDNACRGHDELSCWALAVMFSVARGKSELQNRALSQQYYALAVPLSEASCAQGDADACERAASCYGAGFGVELDRAKSDALRARSIQLEKRTLPGEARP